MKCMKCVYVHMYASVSVILFVETPMLQKAFNNFARCSAEFHTMCPVSASLGAAQGFA